MTKTRKPAGTRAAAKPDRPVPHAPQASARADTACHNANEAAFPKSALK